MTQAWLALASLHRTLDLDSYHWSDVFGGGEVQLASASVSGLHRFAF